MQTCRQISQVVSPFSLHHLCTHILCAYCNVPEQEQGVSMFKSSSSSWHIRHCTNVLGEFGSFWSSISNEKKINQQNQTSIKTLSTRKHFLCLPKVVGLKKVTEERNFNSTYSRKVYCLLIWNSNTSMNYKKKVYMNLGVAYEYWHWNIEKRFLSIKWMVVQMLWWNLPSYTKLQAFIWPLPSTTTKTTICSIKVQLVLEVSSNI